MSIAPTYGIEEFERCLQEMGRMPKAATDEFANDDSSVCSANGVYALNRMRETPNLQCQWWSQIESRVKNGRFRVLSDGVSEIDRIQKGKASAGGGDVAWRTQKVKRDIFPEITRKPTAGTENDLLSSTDNFLNFV